MKYAVLNTDTLQNKGNEGETNVGAVFMTRAVENIYVNLGIDKNSIREVRTCDLPYYEGELVLLPICIHIPRAYKDNELFHISSNIIPIFLSISMTEIDLTEDQVSFFKKYEPIGCRDSQTYHTMQKYGINSYLAGCLVATFPNRRETTPKKILFSDVPKFVEKYIPDDKKKDISFIKQELLLSELPAGVSPKEYATCIFNEYQENACLVVSSRFHSAVLALALGIPFILINETYTYRFSWLKGMPNYYTKANVSQIDWEPLPVDFSRTKELILSIAEYRICQKALELQEDGGIFVLPESIANKQKKDFTRDVEELYTLLEDDEWDQTGQIDYCEGAISYIDENWEKGTASKYALWGINNNAVLIHQYIQKKYPYAVLSHVYDINNNVVFAGMHAESPASMTKSDNEYVIVTTFVAKDVALSLFSEKRIKNFFICEREYINDL